MSYIRNLAICVILLVSTFSSSVYAGPIATLKRFFSKPTTCEQMLNKPRSIDPWIQAYEIDSRATDNTVFSVTDIELLHAWQTDLTTTLDLAPDREIYYIASGQTTRSGQRTITIRKKRISDFAKTLDHAESLVIIDGKIVLQDHWFNHTNPSSPLDDVGAKDHNPLVTAETYHKFISAYEAKRSEYLQIVLRFISRSDLALDDDYDSFDLMRPDIFEFTLNNGVKINTDRGEMTTNNYMSRWTVTVASDGTVFLNDTLGDFVGVLN